MNHTNASNMKKQKQPPEVFCKKRSEANNFIKKEPLAQVFSCEFCEISKNSSSYRTPLASDFRNDKRDIPINSFKTEPLLTLGIRTQIAV